MISALDYALEISDILDKNKLITLKITLDKNYGCSSKLLKSVADLLCVMHLV